MSGRHEQISENDDDTNNLNPIIVYHHCTINRNKRGSRGCDRMVVGFRTTYAIGAYHD